jgi:hypothetical protein
VRTLQVLAGALARASQPALFTSRTKSMSVRARQTRAEPAGFAGSAASREGLGTLPRFPLQST